MFLWNKKIKVNDIFNLVYLFINFVYLRLATEMILMFTSTKNWNQLLKWELMQNISNCPDHQLSMRWVTFFKNLVLNFHIYVQLLYMESPHLIFCKFLQPFPSFSSPAPLSFSNFYIYIYILGLGLTSYTTACGLHVRLCLGTSIACVPIISTFLLSSALICKCFVFTKSSDNHIDFPLFFGLFLPQHWTALTTKSILHGEKLILIFFSFIKKTKQNVFSIWSLKSSLFLILDCLLLIWYTLNIHLKQV